MKAFQDSALIRYHNGATQEVLITDVLGDGGYYAEIDGRNVAAVSFHLLPDGSVVKQRWGRGRNEGTCLGTSRSNARWEEVEA